MRLRSLFVVAALAMGLAGAAAPAQAEHRGLPPVLRPAAVNLFPEGVAWDPSRRALLVGSVTITTPARISAVGRDGVARTIVSDPDLAGYAGIKVDAKRNRILAVFSNPVRPGATGVAIYDLRTGARTGLVNLASGTPGERSPNDLALDAAGNAYVTDVTAGAVYRVDLAGTVSTVASDPRLGPAGANGIVWHPDGYLVVVHYTTGQLFRIAHGDVTEVWTPEPLVGGDGMALHPDGKLVVVTNGLASAGVSAVHELWLTPGGSAALPLRTHEPWPDPAPTTVAVTPNGDYVVDGRIDVALSGGTATDFVLRRV